MSEPNWWDDRTMPNDDGPDWERDADGVLWQIDPPSGRRMRVTEEPRLLSCDEYGKHIFLSSGVCLMCPATMAQPPISS